MTASEIAARIPGVRKTPNGFIGRCPAHQDSHPSLSISEGRDGRALLTCRAGCKTSDVVAALHLEMRDLFASNDNFRRECRRRERFDHSYRRAPRRTFETFMTTEVERQRALRIDRRPFDTPSIRSADVNAARAQATTIFGLRLAPIAPYLWEGYEPHDRDPAFPHLFARALEEESHRWHHSLHRDAPAWETSELPRHLHWHVAKIAVRWLRTLAA